MKVDWTDRALRHLTEIYEYIAEDSPQYALRTVDRITARSQQIGRFPRSAPMVSEYNQPPLREVLEGSYRMIYEIRSQRIVVLAVLHATRQLPPVPPDNG